MENKKKCIRCKETKEVKEFYFKNYCPQKCCDHGSYTNKCRECAQFYGRMYKAENKDKLWIARKGQLKTFEGKKYMMYKHMVDRVRYKDFYIKQGTKCEITLDQWLEYVEEHINIYKPMYDKWLKSGYELRHCPTIDRIDPEGDYTLDNIQMLTHADNSLKAAIKSVPKSSKLTKEEVLEIRKAYKGKRGQAKELAKKYKVSYYTIKDIIYRKTWKHI